MNSLTERYLDFDRQTGASVRYSAELRQDETLMTAFAGSFLPRPTFLEAAEQQQLAADLRAVFDLLSSLPHRLTGGDLGRFCRLLGLSDSQTSAVLRTQDGPTVPLGRADLYQDEQGFKLLEFNLTSALGGLENPLFNRAALRDEQLAAFLSENRLDYVDTMSAIVDTVRACLAGTDVGPDPLVALVDVPEAYEPYKKRLWGTTERFTGLGLRMIACHTGELIERQGRLYYGDQPVDVIYRFFLIEDLLTGVEQVEHILRVQEQGGVQIFVPLATEVFGSKRTLALLSDPAVLADLTADEQHLVDRMLPWTRSLVPGPTSTPEGTVELLEYAHAHREDLILKATMLHGGHQITPGWLVQDAEWRELLAESMGSSFVVQQRVRPRPETFLAGEESARRVLNWGVYLTAGGYGGGILRGSSDPDVGVVSIGGGAQVGGLFHQLSPAAG